MNDNKSQEHTNVRRGTVLKVLILGDGGIGKSCLMNRFVNNQFEQNSLHTVGVEFLKKTVTVDSETYTLQIWDTAGQERFRSLRTPFYRGTDICMLTFALNDRTSFENLLSWRKEFTEYADVAEPEHFPIVVVGNKVDLDPSLREVSTEDASLWCREYGDYPYVETSAKDATNVGHAFEMAVRLLGKFNHRLDGKIAATAGETIDLRRVRKTGARKCC